MIYDFKQFADPSGVMFFWSRAMQHSAGYNFIGEYIDEFETELENILGCQSGPGVID
jgi:hypothetical protein